MESARLQVIVFQVFESRPNNQSSVRIDFSVRKGVEMPGEKGRKIALALGGSFRNY